MTQEVKDLILIVLGFLTFRYTVGILIDMSRPKIEPRKENCPPHDWLYEENHLICQKCRMPAGFPDDRMD